MYHFTPSLIDAFLVVRVCVAYCGLFIRLWWWLYTTQMRHDRNKRWLLFLLHFIHVVQHLFQLFSFFLLNFCNGIVYLFFMICWCLQSAVWATVIGCKVSAANIISSFAFYLLLISASIKNIIICQMATSCCMKEIVVRSWVLNFLNPLLNTILSPTFLLILSILSLKTVPT